MKRGREEPTCRGKGTDRLTRVVVKRLIYLGCKKAGETERVDRDRS